MCDFLNISSLDDHGYHEREFPDHDYISQNATTA
jgi:hypothetical protein